MSEERKDQQSTQEQKGQSEQVARPKLEDLDPQESGKYVSGGGTGPVPRV